jgi:protocatechuate 3,4-dioxygenase alpha subunit
MARTRPRAPTPSQTVGPFFGFAMPFGSDADAVAPGSQGAIRIEGQMVDGAGDPVPDGLIEVWREDQFARCRTDAEGAFHVTVRKPGPGPSIGGRTQAPHLDVTVFARGLLRHLATRIYFPDEEEANRLDPILELVAAERRHSLTANSDGGTLRFDIRLQGDDETVFFAL